MNRVRPRDRPHASPIRRGFSLAELLIALVLTGVIGGIVTGMFVATNRLVRRHGRGIATAEALRVPAVVLGGETRWLDPGRDIRAIAADSFAFRAFRGSGLTCGTLDGAVLVRYRGTRLPEAEKDSVLVLAVGGEWAAALVSSRPAPGACPEFPRVSSVEAANPSVVYAWTLAVPASATPEDETGTGGSSTSASNELFERTVGIPVLLFESGSYHISDGAFRYRRGDGGRQPLTAERIDVGASAFILHTIAGMPTVAPADAAEFTMRLAFHAASAEGEVEVPENSRVRVPLVNAAVRE